MGDKTESRRTRPASKAPGEPAPFRSLLLTLTGSSPRDFLARMAVLQVLAEAHLPISSSRELGEQLSWLTGRDRSAALRALRQGGWLEGLVLTKAGQRAYAVLELLRYGDRMMSALRRKSLGE